MPFIFRKEDQKPGFIRRVEKTTGFCFVLFLFIATGPFFLWAIEVDNLIPFTKEGFKKSGEGVIWDSEAPVDIQSEQLDVNFDAHQIVFKGAVKVTQADFSLTAREVIARFGENADDIEKIVAKGNVDIQKADKRAWGEEASYDRKQATIVLRGNPSLQQGKNLLKGKEIRVLLGEDRMEVKGAVTGEFHLSEKALGKGQNSLNRGKE